MLDDGTDPYGRVIAEADYPGSLISSPAPARRMQGKGVRLDAMLLPPEARSVDWRVDLAFHA